MKILRKRFIPDEIIDISADEVLSRNEELIITKWLPIKPREDLGSGKSYTFLNKGWKISKFYDKENNFMYWYCDIIESHYDKETDTYTLVDLLVDLKVDDNNEYEILDMDELNYACEQKIITEEQKTDALRKINELIELVETGKFPPIEE